MSPATTAQGNRDMGRDAVGLVMTLSVERLVGSVVFRKRVTEPPGYGAEPMNQEHAARAVFEDLWNRQDFSSAEELLDTDFTFHIGGTSNTMSISELKRIVDRWHTGFEDFTFDVHAVVSSNDRAAVHATLTGTHTGEWNALRPTGREVRVEHMFFLRFEDNRIVEVWELLDRTELHRQLAGEQGNETPIGE